MEKIIEGIGVKEYGENCRHYHTRWEISDSRFEEYHRPLRPKSYKYLESVGERGADIVRRILSLPGVIKVAIEPYSVRVEKAPLFSWKEFELQIIDALACEYLLPCTIDEIGDTSALDEDFHRGLTE